MYKKPHLSPDTVELTIDKWITTYRWMLTAREIDRHSQLLIDQGFAHFRIPSGGHEATVALCRHLTSEDWIASHYRDKAMLLARGVPVIEFMRMLLGRQSSSSSGRQLPDLYSAPNLRVLSMPTPVGNHALHAVGIAAALKLKEPRSICVCCVGDGTTQQGEFLEAVAESVRWSLPILFLVEDNGYAISTVTRGKTFYSHPDGPAKTFYGLSVRRANGCDVFELDHIFQKAVSAVRHACKPQLVVANVSRLESHTNADNHRLYRSSEQIATVCRDFDPTARLRQVLLERDVGNDRLERIDRAVTEEVSAAAKLALLEDRPFQLAPATPPYPEGWSSRKEYLGEASNRRVCMRDAICKVLRSRLEQDPRTFLYGQDIEDPKGDVFGITRGLSTDFPDRVVNAPLSESTIVGTCIGRALAGQRPVAFIQFADFLPLAFNQIMNELSSIHWRTNGGYSCPIVVMMPCGGYKPGLGPFHAQSNESLLAHTPGIDVVMPYTAADCAGMLNAALESTRPTVFLYPKAALNLVEQATSENVHKQFVPPGLAKNLQTGRDITLVSWGNTVGIASRAARALEDQGVTSDLFDLRWLSPWDESAIVGSVQRTRRLLVVHEDNRMCGLGSEIVARVTEQCETPVRVERVTRPDTFIPFDYTSQKRLLPCYKSVMEAACRLLDIDLRWQTDDSEQDKNCLHIKAVGSGPSDDSVHILELAVTPGCSVKEGDILVELEASKSTFRIVAPVSGRVLSVDVSSGDEVPIGTTLLVIRGNDHATLPAASSEPAQNFTMRRRKPALPHISNTQIKTERSDVGIGSIVGVTGSRRVHNQELLETHADQTLSGILRRTGIETRYWVSGEEDSLSLAAMATSQLLEKEGLTLQEIDMLICSTGYPVSMTPSMACRLLHALSTRHEQVAAFDINAACSGYLYALRLAYDHLATSSAGKALVVTTETPSRQIDTMDFDTAFLFGDAATATLLYSSATQSRSWGCLQRPFISAIGESGDCLSVPLPCENRFITMRGGKVFTKAIRSMEAALDRACIDANLPAESLEFVVPHQANQRMLDAIAKRYGCSVYSNIRHLGNTSSSSIPLALRDVMRSLGGKLNGSIGICSFGGGFTSGASVILPPKN